MKHPRIIVLALVGLLGAFCAERALAQPEMAPQRRLGPPTLTVTGQAETFARPDRAVLVLGTVSQSEVAATAQQQVNEVMNRALEAIRELGIAEESITTVGISLNPVYANERPRPADGVRPADPRIVGYRASNRLRIRIDDLSKVGDIIDAGVKAGANNIEDLSFHIKDETAARSEALRDASKQARSKAEAIAEAMGVRLDGVQEILEGHAQVYPLRMERFGAAAMDMAGTPVQPGQVQVQATVTVTYRIAPRGDARE